MAAKIHDLGEQNLGLRGGRLYVFFCQGCGYHHSFETPPWSWNGDFEKPTFAPSLLVNGRHPPSRCHSFVENGDIRYLADCHHELAGKTITLPDYDDE